MFVKNRLVDTKTRRPRLRLPIFTNENNTCTTHGTFLYMGLLGRSELHT